MENGLLNEELIDTNSNKNKLYNIEDLPEWYRDNEFIKYGYRKWSENILFYSSNVMSAGFAPNLAIFSSADSPSTLSASQAF